MSGFTLHKKSDPCPICSDASGKCRTAESGLVLCMSLVDGSASPAGYRFVKPSKNRLWGVWAVDDGSQTQDDRDRWLADLDRRRELRARQDEQRRSRSMSVGMRHKLYSEILNALELHPDDRADLVRRGLSDEAIAHIRSIDSWQKLGRAFPANLPGIGKDGASLATPYRGYLLPAFTVDGLIAGFQIHNRDRTGDAPKYPWLSSGNSPVNLGNGEIPVSVAYPANPDPSRDGAIGFSEGIFLKPQIAADQLGIPVIGVSGGNFGAVAAQLQATIETLGSTDFWLLADGGSVQNPQVIRQYRSLAEMLPNLRVLWWGQRTKADGDIDECSDEAIASARLISWAEFENFAPKDIPKWFTLETILRKFGKGKPKQAIAPKPPKLNDVDSTYTSGNRHQSWKDAIDCGYKYVQDRSGTGEGKTHETGNLEPELLGVRQIIYASSEHRNPSTETLTRENGWTDLEARHGGLIRDERRKLRRGIPGKDAMSVAANCNRTGLINSLRSKNIQGSDSAELICGGCPLREACQHSSGYGYGFLSQRRDALQSQKLRAHPDSLPGQDYDYSDVVLAWDEPGETFRNSKPITVKRADVAAAIARLLPKGMLPTTSDLLGELLNILEGSTKTGRYGLNLEQARSLLLPLLPDDLDLDQLRSALSPSSELNQLLNPSEQYGADLADLPKAVRKKFVARDSTASIDADQKILKQWLPELIEVLKGDRPGYLNLTKSGFTITLPDDRHWETVAAAKATIFLDATMTREQLALKLGCEPSDIWVVKQEQPKLDNLTITQIKDLGRMGMQRGNDQQRRAAALVEHYQLLPGQTAVIDFKKFEADGAWWRDSRGVNDFQNCDRLVLVGAPCPNLAMLEAEYCILSGRSPFGTDGKHTEAFTQFVDGYVQAEIKQAIGRLRANRRPDKQLEIIIISDVDLEVSTVERKASEITINAASKKEQAWFKIRDAAKQLISQGAKVTQQAIAMLAGYSQSYVHQFWELLQTLLGDSNSKSNNLVDPLVIAETDVVLRHCSTVHQALEVLSGILLEQLHPDQRRSLWDGLSPPARAIAESALLSVYMGAIAAEGVEVIPELAIFPDYALAAAMEGVAA